MNGGYWGVCHVCGRRKNLPRKGTVCRACRVR